MKIVEGDILDVTEGVIVHQVNTKGVMGAGLAWQIRNKYPVVYDEYLELFRLDKLQLGTVQIARVSDRLSVCNLVAQYSFGKTGNYTDYDSFEAGLKKLKQISHGYGQLYLPYKIGAGLAGGDWQRLQAIIERVVPDAILVKR